MNRKKLVAQRITSPDVDPKSINDQSLTPDQVENIHKAIAFKPPQKIIEEKLDENIEEGKLELNPISKGVSLQDFELQRKLMEEQNKQKRDLLQRAISKHAEKTAAESKKLQEVKSELEKLDSELASDVAILRKQIDLASYQYSNIQKHYNNVEMIFLKAKQDLFLAHEKKDLLTQHLCTIIAHNEDRKAKRLTELMEKVGLTSNNLDEKPN
jgi:RAB6-interacting golgin